MLLAIALRGGYYLELQDSPGTAVHHWDQSDMHYYDGWARQIVAGDWLSAHVDPPLHGWHRNMARAYAERHPGKWEALVEGGAAAGVEPATLLWRRWLGAGRFYQDPLYAYFVAGVYATMGPDPLNVFVLQMVVGVLTLLLLLGLTRRLFGEVAAVAAAGMALFYGPLLAYEGVLLRATLIAFVGLLLADNLERCRADSGGFWRWLGFGALCGAAILLKTHFVLIALGGMLLAIVWHRARPGRAALAVATAVGGLLIGASPLAARNIAVGVPPLATATGGAVTLVLATTHNAEGVIWDAAAAARIMEEHRNETLPMYFAAIRTHPSLLSYVDVLLRRTAALTGNAELPNNISYEYYQTFAPVLRGASVPAGVIVLMGIGGIVASWLRKPRGGPLLILAAASVVMPVLLWSYCRFRLPLVVALAPFAGLAVSELIRAVVNLANRRREVGWRPWRAWQVVGAAVLALLIGARIVAPIVMPPPTMIRVADCDVGLRYFYFPLVEQAMRRSDADAAVDTLALALEREPEAVRRLLAGLPPRSMNEMHLAGLYAEFRTQFAQLLQDSPLQDDAERLMREAQRLREVGPAVGEP